ncbi:BTB/POZ domain-containing protein [Ditylenchus destructor]|uniref:BTB/POZ domain-containing protein n=1 Tax=Ditylenchus destructor TaxID=166010 RepID=A0AAD4QSA1_9BILA|nr:BTB/POZ domain-containing protein [Ditylenchus destructor]
MSEEGNVELKIDQFSEFVRGKIPRSSSPTYIYGLRWKIVALTGRSEILSFYLWCNEEDDDPSWNCQTNAKLQIVSQKAGVDDHFRQVVKMFSSKTTFDGYPEFIRCDELLDPENGFIKDDIVILRAHVKAEIPQGVQIAKLQEIPSSISDPLDGALIVKGNRIPIQKMYLSYYSEYFKTMFASEFKEGREDEIVIEEVGYVDMLQLLSVIYPFNAQITDKNLKVILKLADRFIMPAVLEQCKKQLKISTLNGAQKLLLAQQYNFKDLLKEFAQQCKTAEDAKKLKSEPEYKLLDFETRALILDSIDF